MLFVVSALGIIGGVLLALDGLVLGSGVELEHIAAIACFALAAAGLVGLIADDGSRARSRPPLTLRGVLEMTAAAPIIALSVGVFVATLIPSLFVSLPFLVVWWLGSTQRRAARAQAAAGAVEHPLHAPAYA